MATLKKKLSTAMIFAGNTPAANSTNCNDISRGNCTVDSCTPSGNWGSSAGGSCTRPTYRHSGNAISFIANSITAMQATISTATRTTREQQELERAATYAGTARILSADNDFDVGSAATTTAKSCKQTPKNFTDSSTRNTTSAMSPQTIASVSSSLKTCASSAATLLQSSASSLLGISSSSPSSSSSSSSTPSSSAAAASPWWTSSAVSWACNIRKSSTAAISFKCYFFLWHFFCILASCFSLSMTEVRIPKHIMRYEDASLGCKYDLDGESLYSVKWYKDGFEFYRYVPRDMPPGQVFPLPGVDVDLQNSTDNVVVLHRVTLQSTGRYRCEVSGEAPSFQTVSGHEDMIVVVTPTKGPQITGGKPRYQIGDPVSVNCTSAPSKPICHLSWLINGVHANRSFLRYYEPRIVGREGLEVATLGLEFRVRG